MAFQSPPSPSSQLRENQTPCVGGVWPWGDQEGRGLCPDHSWGGFVPTEPPTTCPNSPAVTPGNGVPKSWVLGRGHNAAAIPCLQLARPWAPLCRGAPLGHGAPLCTGYPCATQQHPCAMEHPCTTGPADVRALSAPITTPRRLL